MAAVSVFWEQQIDKKYNCIVERKMSETYSGILKLMLKGVVLKSKNVVITYGGPFGPDAGDVGQWQNQCAEWVDDIRAKASD